MPYFLKSSHRIRAIICLIFTSRLEHGAGIKVKITNIIFNYLVINAPQSHIFDTMKLVALLHATSIYHFIALWVTPLI